jgi:hypothetical protein
MFFLILSRVSWENHLDQRCSPTTATTAAPLRDSMANDFVDLRWRASTNLLFVYLNAICVYLLHTKCVHSHVYAWTSDDIQYIYMYMIIHIYIYTCYIYIYTYVTNWNIYTPKTRKVHKYKYIYNIVCLRTFWISTGINIFPKISNPQTSGPTGTGTHSLWKAAVPVLFVIAGRRLMEWLAIELNVVETLLVVE